MLILRCIRPRQKYQHRFQLDNFEEKEVRLIYVLYGFGLLFVVSGIAFLAAEYVKYMSEIGKLVSLMLTVGIFASLTKYFTEIGW